MTRRNRGQQVRPDDHEDPGEQHSTDEVEVEHAELVEPGQTPETDAGLAAEFPTLTTERDELGVAIQDPWKHRSVSMKCATCMWWVVKTYTDPDAGVDEKNSSLNQSGPYPDERGKLGRCRRRAPTLNGFPAVFEVDWCGDHKLDERKL